MSLPNEIDFKIIRKLLVERDQTHPGSKSRAERVAVYAVAIGDQLGLDLPALRRLRAAAELNELAVTGSNEGLKYDLDSRSPEIVRLAVAFDVAQSELGDEAATEWLEQEASETFEPDLVGALNAVRSVIQPVR